jgi:hypothetical protein
VLRALTGPPECGLGLDTGQEARVRSMWEKPAGQVFGCQ